MAARTAAPPPRQGMRGARKRARGALALARRNDAWLELGCAAPALPPRAACAPGPPRFGPPPSDRLSSSHSSRSLLLPMPPTRSLYKYPTTQMLLWNRCVTSLRIRAAQKVGGGGGGGKRVHGMLMATLPSITNLLPSITNLLCAAHKEGGQDEAWHPPRRLRWAAVLWLALQSARRRAPALGALPLLLPHETLRRPPSCTCDALFGRRRAQLTSVLRAGIGLSAGHHQITGRALPPCCSARILLSTRPLSPTASPR